MSARTSAALMLKAPLPGFVKTRLAAEIGDEEAANIYKRMAERQLDEIPSDWAVMAHYTPFESLDLMREWLGTGLEFRPQVEGDLGDRMGAAAEVFFESASDGSRQLVFLGGDCPGANSGVLKEVERRLEEVDVVFGPALDGGYWCLGLKRFVPEVFQGIPWSSKNTLNVTKSRLREAGIAFDLGPVLEDVDDLDSFNRCRFAIRG